VGHMVQHLLIGMYGPLFLVLSAPVLLALKALPVNSARTVTAILRSRVFFLLSHPVTTLFLNMGGMYLLYLTPLYVKSLFNPFLHYLIHFHFLAAGFLFTWSMIGQEPVARRPAFGIRVFVLFISIAAHAFLSKYMYAYLYPIHSPHSADQIREAAKLMYYWGDLSELLLAFVLFGMWYQTRNSVIKLEPTVFSP
jgi:putative membrane protein